VCIKTTSLCFVNSVKVLAGAEIWMLEAAQALRKRGVDTSFVATPGSPLMMSAQAEGFRTIGIPIRFDTAPWTIFRLWTFFRRHRFDAVICNQIKDLKAAGTAARLAGIPRVMLTRESDFPLRARFYYRWYLKRVATGLLVNSLATRRTTLASAPWLDENHIHLLYKGVDTERYRPTTSTPTEPVIGFAGQLVERKGLRVLMAAWKQFDRDASAPHLLITGDGPLADELQSWRSGLRHPQRVVIEKQTDDMPAFYRRLSLLVLPSHQEGYGLVAAEAASCGLPVIAANASSLPELVIDGETGMLVPAGDAAALADAMDRLTRDPETSARMGRAGRDYMISEHDREGQIDNLIRLIT
jgi:glycosyltransferase involved in cell wall biosynthesis